MTDIIEVDGLTGEVIERPFTEAEAAQRAADERAAAEEQAAAAAQAATAAEARRKIAEASGLTPEEMAALGF